MIICLRLIEIKSILNATITPFFFFFSNNAITKIRHIFVYMVRLIYGEELILQPSDERVYTSSCQ